MARQLTVRDVSFIRKDYANQVIVKKSTHPPARINYRYDVLVPWEDKFNTRSRVEFFLSTIMGILRQKSEIESVVLRTFLML